MNIKDKHADNIHSLRLLSEIAENNELTQRDMSKKLGVALGLVNSYLKNLISKGYITVAAIPRKRYKYYLTPSGFAKKTRLTFQHLQNFTTLYRVARRDFQSLFGALKKDRKKKIVLCGIDEITEIAFLSLKEADLELAGIIDSEDNAVKIFLGYKILPLDSVRDLSYDAIIITSFQSGDRLKDELASIGVAENKILDISAGGWIKRLES